MVCREIGGGWFVVEVSALGETKKGACDATVAQTATLANKFIHVDIDFGAGGEPFWSLARRCRDDLLVVVEPSINENSATSGSSRVAIGHSRAHENGKPRDEDAKCEGVRGSIIAEICKSSNQRKCKGDHEPSYIDKYREHASSPVATELES